MKRIRLFITRKVLDDLTKSLNFSIAGEITKEHLLCIRERFMDDNLPYNCMSFVNTLLKEANTGDVLDLDILN